MASQLETLAAQVIERLGSKGLKLTLAESLTGGLVSSSLVSVPGASKVLLASVVSYSNEAKHSLLKVPSDVLNSVGAVSEKTALAMANGARESVRAESPPALIAASVTGVAGPDLQDGKPVGTVFIGYATASFSDVTEHHFSGDREAIRTAAAVAVLEQILEQNPS